MKVKLITSYVGEGLKHILYLAFGFYLSLNIAPFFGLPYRNPLNIANKYIPEHFSPETNFTRILLIILGSVAIYYLLWWLDRSKRSGWFKALIVFYVFLNYFLIKLLPTYVAAGGLDVFHSGEQLSPTLAFMQGKHLFSQIFLFHGAGDDVLSTLLSFKIFQPTIGSYILFGFVEQFIAATAFFVLLAKIVKDRLIFMLLALVAYGSACLNYLYIRDAPVWISLLIVLLLLTKPLTARWRAALMATLGVLAAGSCFFSVDRGLLLVGLDGLVAIIWLFMDRDHQIYRFNRWAWRSAYPDVLWMAGGVAAVFALATVLLGPGDMGEFLKITFVELPKIKGLISEYPFPQLYPSIAVWTPVLAMVVVALMLAELLRREYKRLSAQTLYALVVTIFAIMFFRSGVGRSDMGHIAYASTPLFVAAILLVQALWRKGQLWPARGSIGAALPTGILLVLLLAPTNFSFVQLASIPNYRRDEVREFFHMVRYSDDYWLPAEVKTSRDYILKNSAPKDGLFAYTSNPIYYYATKRPNPSRFYISWFADPQPYTNELMRDLKRNPPKFIVYRDGLHDAPDLVSMDDRIPEVNTWILANYHLVHQTGETQILEHGPAPKPEPPANPSLDIPAI